MKFNAVKFSLKLSLPFYLLVILSGLLLGGCVVVENAKLKNQPMQFETEMEAQRIQSEKQAELKENAAKARKIKENEDKINKENYIKEVYERNAEKIKNLRFPDNLLNSIILTHALGQWSDLIPFKHWVGLMLENKNISTIEFFSARGNPGVLVKESGKPGVGFIFRVEGGEAYPHALVSAEKYGTVNASDQLEIAFMVMRLINKLAEKESTPSSEQKTATAKVNALGLVVRDLTAAQKRDLRVRGGVVVDSAADAAARASLQEGDVILMVANTEVSSVKEFEVVVARLDNSRPVSLLIRRGDGANYVLIRPAK